MTLAEFSERQERAVNKAAADAYTMACLNPCWDMEGWFRRQRKVNPLLRGVSESEFYAAAFNIRPFRNT